MRKFGFVFAALLSFSAISLTGCLMAPDDGGGDEPIPDSTKDCTEECKASPERCRTCKQVPEFDDGVSPDPLPWRPTVPPSQRP